MELPDGKRVLFVKDPVVVGESAWSYPTVSGSCLCTSYKCSPRNTFYNPNRTTTFTATKVVNRLRGTPLSPHPYSVRSVVPWLERTLSGKNPRQGPWKLGAPIVKSGGVPVLGRDGTDSSLVRGRGLPHFSEIERSEVKGTSILLPPSTPHDDSLVCHSRGRPHRRSETERQWSTPWSRHVPFRLQSPCHSSPGMIHRVFRGRTRI